MTIAVNLSWLAFLSHVCWLLVSPETYPCGLDFWANSIFSFVGTDMSLVRQIRLLFHFSITKSMADLNEAKRTAQGLRAWRPNWYMRNRWLMYPKVVLTILLCLWAFYLIVDVLFTVSTNTLKSGLSPCTSLEQGGAGAEVWFLLVITFKYVFSFFIVWKLRPFKRDAYSFQLETYLATLVALAAFLIYIIVVVIGQEQPIVYRILFNMVGLMFCMFSEAWPLYSTRAYEQQQAARGDLVASTSSRGESIVSSVTGLRETIANDQAMDLFMQYLETEFSSENLMFYRDVIEYKKMDQKDVSGLREKAFEIYNQYIVDGAELQVNISYLVLEPLVSKMNQWRNPNAEINPEALYTVFDEAQEEVYRLMESDSYRRFQTSELYQRLPGMSNINGSQTTHTSSNLQHEGATVADKHLGDHPESVEMTVR